MCGITETWKALYGVLVACMSDWKDDAFRSLEVWRNWKRYWGLKMEYVLAVSLRQGGRSIEDGSVHWTNIKLAGSRKCLLVVFNGSLWIG